ncbi:MAG: hypothetical protein QM727_10715 [Niabella sp.]
MSATMMTLVLLWLTVSLPVVNAARQGSTCHAQKMSDNPFAGVTEEKTPVSVNLTEEYIHHDETDFSIPGIPVSVAYIHAHEPIYIAFHGEMLTPPPNVTA